MIQRRLASDRAKGRLLVAGVLLCLLTQSGCFYLGADTFEDVVQRPPSDWSSRDCLTVIVSTTMNNLSDKNSVVQVIATPYFPSVITAINQLQRTQHHWTESEAVAHADELMRGANGLFVDWRDGKFMNARGSYYRSPTDMDSLLILITLRNTSFPCNVPTVTMNAREVPLMAPADWPCYIPEITDLDSRICLLNARRDTLRPRFVWGRKNHQFTTEETLFAMFPLRKGGRHFLENSAAASLLISGFQTELLFPIDLSKMR